LRLVFDADDLGQLRRGKEGVAVGKAHPFGIEIAFRKVGLADFVIVRFDGRVLGGFQIDLVEVAAKGSADSIRPSALE
jgi:hypothetical protein